MIREPHSIQFPNSRCHCAQAGGNRPGPVERKPWSPLRAEQLK